MKMANFNDIYTRDKDPNEDIIQFMEKLFNVKRENRVIKFKPITNTGFSVTVTPARNSATGEYKGIRKLTPEQKNQVTYYADENSKRILKSGFKLDLSNIVDCIDWQWMQHTKGIALSLQEANSRNDVQFYVYDEVRENNAQLKINEIRTEAASFISSLSDDKLYEVLRVMGDRMDGHSAETVRNHLYSVAFGTDTDQINRLVSIKYDPNVNIKSRVHKAVDGGIISIKDGLYYFGEILLGKSLDETVLFFKNYANKSITDEIIRKINPDFELMNTLYASDEAPKKVEVSAPIETVTSSNTKFKKKE